MTKLTNYSIQRLFNIDNGITKLFYYAMAGMENGGPDINREDARSLTDLLNHQTDIQKVLYEKVESRVGKYEIEIEHIFDGINEDNEDTE
jgi:hypothetical protein